MMMVVVVVGWLVGWVGGWVVGIKLLCHSICVTGHMTKFCFLLGSTLPCFFLLFVVSQLGEPPYTQLAKFMQGLFSPPGPSSTP